MLKAINIMWDVDYDGDGNLLPTEINIPEGMTDEEEICEYLSDATGFCHEGFDLVVGLCTFPDNDKNYCKYFEIHENYLIDILERIDNTNEQKGVNLDDFLNNYVWDETWFIYENAKNENKLIMEKEED